MIKKKAKNCAHRRELAILVSLCACVAMSSMAMAAKQNPAGAPDPLGPNSERPNIVLILLDNTGWGDFGPYGGGELRGAPSPSIDKLATEGLTLTNFNTEPQCTPSRSALMTGRFAIRSGTQSVPIGVPYYGLLPWEETIAERTAYFRQRNSDQMQAVDHDMMRENAHSTMTINQPDRQSRVTFGGPRKN